MARKITVTDSEAGPCDCCGFHLLTGDTAVWVESRTYCKNVCAIAGEEYIRRREMALEYASYHRGE